MAAISLKGITWDHSRGITPLLAASQRYHELNPGIEIVWEKRSLQHFADYPLERLAEHFDLLVIDHPWVGCAAETGAVIPLDEHISKSYLEDQEQNTVGLSHSSYHYAQRQWALAIDAATPAASYRKDLFEKNSSAVPETWETLIALAKEGKVAAPAIPIDLLMSFYSFCNVMGSAPFRNEHEVVDTNGGLAALSAMQQLYSLVDKKCFDYNPINVAEWMSASDETWYCPFAYCYSNYSRNGYAENLLHYADTVRFSNGALFNTTIGGTGLAVSSFSQNIKEAVQFAEMVASPEWQSGLYVQNGGHPGHLTGWLNEDANRITNNFFTNLLPAMQRGYMRPRYNGYLFFQDEAGIPLQRYLRDGGDPATVLKDMNAIYKESLIKSEIRIV